MSVGPETAPAPGVISAVLRSGADALAPAPGESAQSADPGLQPALQRLTEPPADAVEDDPAQSFADRAARSVLLAPVLLRLIVLTCATALLAAVFGDLALLVAVVVVLEAGDLALLAVTLRRHVRSATLPLTRPVLLGTGLLLALAANLLVAATSSADAYIAATSITGAYLAGTVVVWTVAWGGANGAVPVVLNVPLQLAMIALNRHRDPGGTVPHLLAFTVAGCLGLAVAWVAALLALAVLGYGTRVSLLAGIRAGQESERVRMLRGMHDTVLQTLEVMALSTPDDRARPAQALANLRRLARGQATQIRRVLGTMDAPHAADDGLRADLDDVVAELSNAGLRVECTIDSLEEDLLGQAGRIALRDATREALRNVLKHAGTDRAVLRVEQHEEVLAVVVRDHGCGFAPAATSQGFGLTHSVGGRLAEVGGAVEIWSRPGRGTRVTLRLPLSGQ